jgi:hypothetical protein
MSLDEVASSLVDFGHDVNEIASTLSDVFSAGPAEIASGLALARSAASCPRISVWWAILSLGC